MDQQEINKIIMSHYKTPQKMSKPDGEILTGHMVNRSCGDEVELYLKVDGSRITSAGFSGRGCSMCIASADILCSELEGQEVAAGREIASTILAEYGEEGYTKTAELPGDVPALMILKDYPMRQKCATMSWKILLDLTG